MGTVIYSASPLQAFIGAFAAVLVMLVIGLLGIGVAAFRRNQGRAVRLISGGLGVLLLIGGCVLTASTLVSMSAGTQTLTVRFDDKTIAQDSCGDNGETCARYVLSATSSANAYDFDVPQSAYEQARVHGCYAITYYPNKGLASQGSYQRINSITRIATADPSACP